MADPADNEQEQNSFSISRQLPGPVAGDTGKEGKDPEGQGAGGLVPEVPCPVEPMLHETVEDPVEILVGLAERGEIDPWNINIIEVTDRFLTELERRRQLNLQVSGRTLFYAATLLRMKSEHLTSQSDAEETGPDEDDESFGEDFDLELDSEIDYQGRLGPIERLEHEIQRRLDRKNMRKSPVTLFELIIELKNIEKEERRRRLLSDAGDDLILTDDVVGIAHDEGYLESAVTVLESCLESIDPEGELTLEQLCQKLGWGIPEVYISLLFLALEGQCCLRQEEFFGDIYVQVCKADGD
jgi:segregation and condensation protein A